MSKYSWMVVAVLGVSLMVASVGMAVESAKPAPAAATCTATAAPAAK